MFRKCCNVLIQLGIISLIVFPPLPFGAVQHRFFIQLIILGIGSVWVIKTLMTGKLRYMPTPLDLPVLCFLGLGIVNWLTSTYAHSTEKELYLFANYILLYVLVVQHLKTTRRIIGLAFIILLVGSGESLFGLFQYLQGATTVLGYETPNIGTVNATYFNHNHFAGFLILVIPIALGLLFGAAHLEKKFFVFILLALLGATLVLTLSRGGLLSFFLSSGFFGFCLSIKHIQHSDSWRKYLVVLLVLMICIGFYVAWIGISPIAHRSLFETFFPNRMTVEEEIRFQLWKNALPLIKEFPLFGSGLGTFHDVFLRYRPESLAQERQAFHAHNDYLELLIEMGIPGLLLALWAMSRVYHYVLASYFQTKDPLLASLALGGLTSCTAIWIHSFFDFNLQIPANALLFYIILAMTIAIIRLISHEHRAKHGETQQKDVHRPSWKFAFLALIVFILLAFNFRTNLAYQYFSKARTLEIQYSPFEAIQWYQKAKRIDNANALFSESLAKLYTELGKTTPHAEKWYHLAILEYQQALTLNAYYPAYYYQLGWVYAALEMEQKAVDAFKQAIALNPRIAFYYENLGDYYFSFDLIEPSLKMYQEAIRLDPPRMQNVFKRFQEYGLTYAKYQHMIPEGAEYREQFATLLKQQGDWEHSKQEYRHAIELSGGQAEYYQAMLSACQTKNDFDCMRTLWQELWQQSPENLDYQVKIAESFASQQQWAQAITHYETLLREHPNSETKIYRRLAELYRQQGREKDALQLYTRLLEQLPTELSLYHEIAGMYRQQQDWQAAIEIYDRALASGLTQPELSSQLGELYLKTNNPRQALEAYEQAIQSGETRFATYQTIEQLYQAQNNTVALDFLWENYLVANRQNPAAIFQLVQHYVARGEWLKAVTLSKELIANAPTNVTYRSFLAGLYEQKMMWYEAIEQWEKLSKLNAQNLDYKMHLAALYEQVNQAENARRQYRQILQIQPNHPQAQQRLVR
ncbi:O-antigen polymerase involved in exopolysaccharide biosynthesis [Candidatus Vecturithrix granuli]|uniref:O-antigen polymerase involved in exopolysaccharide biosynthesis n=1 Tax=Vecturithrix granuli TaxID=1499967 RepID=A0A0S6W986_VECG1|nr:O-antigen polymerase involved in exopolysaccharide biosynthesis [Candidatus Vecturithrix granuli]